MDGLEARVLAARTDRQDMDALVRDYLPFLKKQAAQEVAGLDYDDRLSLAMVAFTAAAAQYDQDRGAFLPFAQVCIRNRLADEGRRARRYGAHIVELTEEYAAPDPYDRAMERAALAQEIGALDRDLSVLGVTFQSLAEHCPRQIRARRQCMQLAACLAADPALREDFRRTGRLPQKELARRFSLSPKTVEKHRKYIAALAVILLGDYPGIRAFLPKGEVEA